MTGNSTATNAPTQTPCKLVELGGNGDLTILKGNLDRMLSHFEEVQGISDIPIAVVSILGPHLSGKSFFANLLMEYVKHDGEAWTKEMRESGLKGFPYGSGNNRVSDEEMESSTSGVYFWPELFPIEQHCTGKKILLLVMDVHHQVKTEGGEQPERKLVNLFAAVSSSRIADIVWEEKWSVTRFLQNDDTAEVKLLLPQMCQSIVYLERSTKSKGCAKKENTIAMREFPKKPLHDNSGIIQFSLAQQGVVDKLIRAIIEESELHPKIFGKDRSVLKLGLIDKFLDHYVRLINEKNAYNHLLSKELEENNDVPPIAENGNADNLEDDEKRILSKDDEETSTTEDKTGIIALFPTTTENLISFSADRSERKKKNDKLEEYKQKLASHSIWPDLHGSFNKWICNELKRENVGEIIFLFDTFLQHLSTHQVAKLKEMGMSETESVQFIESIRKKDMQDTKFIDCFRTVGDGLQRFCKNVEDEFLKTLFFPTQDFKSFVKATVEHMYASIGGDVSKDLFEFGVTKLTPYYERQNTMIMDASLECINQIRSFYKEEMAKIVISREFQRPRKLMQIHAKLSIELQRVYQNSMGFPANILHPLENLQQQLDIDFVEHERTNLRMIEVAMKNVNSLILKWKSEYEVKMDQFLEENPNGIELTTFDVKTGQIEEETIRNFMTESTETLINVGTLNNYMQTLQQYIWDSRDDMRKENEDNLSKYKMKADFCQPDSSYGNGGIKKEESDTQENYMDTYNEQKELTPLLIQLNTEKIGVCLFQGNNRYLNHYLPEIGITTDGKWVCGNELLELINSDNQHNLRNQWHIGKYILPQGDESGKAENGSHYSAEFLLAVFLRYVKQAAEIELITEISEAMISVPIWCPSTYRQRVTDGAKLAGFNEVHICNENSCAAYYMYSSGQHTQYYDTVVFSENSEMIDITLYQYSSQENKLSMLNYFGDSFLNINETKKGWLENLFQLFGNVFGYYKLRGDESAIDKIHQLCQCLINKAKTKHSHRMSINRHFLIISDSPKYTQMLTGVAEKYTTNFISNNDNAVLFGMASIYKLAMPLKNIIEERLPFCISIFSPSAYNSGENKKKHNLSFNHGPQIFYLPKHISFYKVVEENSLTKSKYPIADIYIHPEYLDPRSIDIWLTLERSHQGIIAIQRLEWRQKNGRRSPFEQNKYEWRSYNINCEGHDCATAMKDIVFYNKAVAKLEKARQDLWNKCHSVMQAIHEGKGNFKKDLVKNLVLSELNEIIELLKNSQISGDYVNQKCEVVSNLCSKYRI